LPCSGSGWLVSGCCSLRAAAVAGEGFGGADDGRPDAVRSPFGGPDVQAVELGTVRVALVHLRGGASAPQDLAGPDGDAAGPRDQEGAGTLLLTLEPSVVVPGLAGRGVAGFQQREVLFPALPDVHRSCPFPSTPAQAPGR
jgi:hypothetical protein